MTTTARHRIDPSPELIAHWATQELIYAEPVHLDPATAAGRDTLEWLNDDDTAAEPDPETWMHAEGFAEVQPDTDTEPGAGSEAPTGWFPFSGVEFVEAPEELAAPEAAPVESGHSEATPVVHEIHHHHYEQTAIVTAAPIAGGLPVVIPTTVSAPAAPQPVPEASAVPPHRPEPAPAPAPVRRSVEPMPEPVPAPAEYVIQEPALEEIPDQPSTLFVWRGRPVGRPRQQQQPARQRRTPRAAANPTQGDAVNAQTWFDDTCISALQRGVSDLHILAEEDENTGEYILTARVRIDGRLRHYARIVGDDAMTIMGKFKANAGLSTGGSFVPEETIYEIEYEGEFRKARVAMVRTHAGGDYLVLRLPPTGPLRSLEELDFAPENLALLIELLRSHNRMILIAGPMGSGKTTTVHGCIKRLATSERAVVTIEDPVERRLANTVQLEIDEENGAGFEALLPVMVRSDYDTLFLGEIRDKATAQAAVRQAKAGRQVISTIHANDNVTALQRLIELAEDTPLSVLDAVRGVVSQRLVARINPEWDGANEEDRYRGRAPVHEVLQVSDELTEALSRDRPIAEIKAIAARTSDSTFKRDAQRLLDAGVTDSDEIDRVLLGAGSQ